MRDNTIRSRRGFLRTSALTGSLLAGGSYSARSVSAQEEDRLEANNNQIQVELDDIESRSYLSSFDIDGQNLLGENKRIQPSYLLSHSETINSVHITADGWDGYRTERRFEYEGDDQSAESTLRITQTTALPANEPIAITQIEITNEGEETTIERPDSHIHDGWIVSRLPPLRDPTGTYRYYIEGEETRIFEDGDLWDATNLSSDQRFVTHFGDDLAVTTSYLDGPTETIQTVTYTSADVDDQNDLPHSEDNPPARQTIGFSIDGIDLCVEGFSIDTGETVSFTTAQMAHTGGSEAVARAEELTQTAESLSNDLPTFEEGRSEGALATVFQQAQTGSNNPLFIGAIGAAILGTGYGIYRKVNSDTNHPPQDEISTTAEGSKTPAVDDPTADSTPVIDGYADIDLGGVVETADNAQIQSGTVGHHSVWVVTPNQTSGETVDSEQIAQFTDPFKTWAQMDSSPNVLSIYESGMNPLPWAAVEQADYIPLVECVDSLSVTETLDTLKQVCNALHHVHRYGATYNNLTTASVLYTDENTVKLRGVLDQFEDLDQWYNAPEEFDDESTERSTVYRIGLIAYELFTGELPYETYPDGDPKEAIESANISESASIDQLPLELTDEIVKALSKESGHRHETVLHLRDSLSAISIE